MSWSRSKKPNLEGTFRAKRHERHPVSIVLIVGGPGVPTFTQKKPRYTFPSHANTQDSDVIKSMDLSWCDVDQ